MKVINLILLLIFVSCSQPKKEQNASISEAQDSLITETLSTEKSAIKKEAFDSKGFELKEKIDRYFENIEKMKRQNEFGGGDCWDTFTEYKTKIDGFYAIEDKMDCGDYGFTKFRLIQSKDKKPDILEKVTKEWLITDSIPYLMKEWIVDFRDTSKIFYRVYSTDKYDLLEIPDSVSFNHGTTMKSLNVDEAISTINGSRTAEND